MENENAAWDGIAFVASEPVGEYCVGCVFTRLVEHGDRDSGAYNILNESSMLVLDLTVKLGGVAVDSHVHEGVVR